MKLTLEEAEKQLSQRRLDAETLQLNIKQLQAQINALKNGGGSGSQIQSDWTQLDNTKVDYIKHKPVIPIAQTIPNPVIGFIINDATTGINVGPGLIAARTASVVTCKVYIKVSDASVAFTFTIKQNGTSVFSTPNTIAAGTGAGLITFTNLTNNPLAITADDIFTIDVISGNSNWKLTIQLE